MDPGGRSMSNNGINAQDPRNAGIIEYLRPRPVTMETIVERLGARAQGKTDLEIRNRARQMLETIESKPHRPDPPLSQPIERAPHPWFGLGTHPDLVETLWELDKLLPERCRWLLWGYPALVRADNGVVFAAAFGTIGILLRLPSEVLGEEEAEVSRNLTTPPDFSPAISDWHLVKLQGSVHHLGMRAYERAE